MRSRSMLATIAMMFGLLVTHAPLARSQGAATWLDAPRIASWNTPGQPIPAAPKARDATNDRCRAQVRPPQIDEDKSLRDRGWDLIGAFQSGWQVVVVRGAASYDGMCRPLQYQDFVFVRGIFAGTLAPAPMDSRTDGALGQVALQSPTELTAVYSRYAASDALCCPSRTTRVTFQVTADPPLVRAEDAVTSRTAAAPIASQPPSSSAPLGLAGTSWQLVRFEGGDGAVLTPSDRAMYTIDFGTDGRLSARIDCNRGRGTWTSKEPGEIALGPLALTRARCLQGSLHDQIVKQWDSIRSYVIRDGHLHLALIADGGIYEFEPMTKLR